MLTKNIPTVLVAFLLLSGCQQNGQQSESADTKDSENMEKPTVVRDAESPAQDGQPGMSYEEQIESAKADFAKRFKKSDDEFEVWEAVAVDWASGAIGCPMKDMNYTMALVPGFKVVIKSGETLYQYNARKGGAPFFCPPDRVEDPAATARGAIM